MFQITVTIDVDATDDEQCRTVARKVNEAIKSATRQAPYRITHKIVATRVNDSPIIQPESVSMIKSAVPRRTL